MTDLISFTAGGVTRRVQEELLSCNEYLKEHGGIVLSEKDIRALAENRQHVLRSYGRMEFGSGVMSLLAKTFCTSPDIDTACFASVLCDLTEIFYAVRNETDGEASDEELIEAMRTAFDGSCHGSVELLAAMSPRVLLSIVKEGRETAGGIDDDPLDHGDVDDGGDGV